MLHGDDIELKDISSVALQQPGSQGGTVAAESNLFLAEPDSATSTSHSYPALPK